jgi:hypothetical protein
VRKLVEPFCAKHGIKYTSTSLWEGTKQVLQHLRQVTVHMRQEFPAM